MNKTIPLALTLVLLFGCLPQSSSAQPPNDVQRQMRRSVPQPSDYLTNNAQIKSLLKPA